MPKYKSIFISDLHLGARACNAEAICEFLKQNSAEKLYLVGDIIDGWRLKKKWHFPQSHVNVIRQILTSAKNGTEVHYLAGNHDEAMRDFLPLDNLGRIEFSNRQDYIGIDGKRYLVIHGDMFDSLMWDKKWLMHAGDAIYDFLIWFNVKFNFVRKRIGLNYWSLSKFLKSNTKSALNYINKFEEHVADYCKNKGYDGIICGHIHSAEIREINEIKYMNDGDWCESCTALVEHHSGKWEIIHWKVK